MIKFFLKKFTIFIVCLFLIVSICFFLMKLLPGDPFVNDQSIPEEVLNSLKAHYGLDQPLWKQYLLYLKGCFTFDLGPSLIFQGKKVQDIIRESFLVSAKIGLQALIFSTLVGFTLGSVSALKREGWMDNFSLLISTLGLSIPSFVIAALLQYYLSIKLSLFPLAKWEAPFSSVLPSLALSLTPIAYLTRLIRSSLIEVLSKEHIQMSQVKGLSPFYILVRHALPCAMVPVLGYFGPFIAYLLTGSFIIEKVFALPGLGSWMIQSILQRDYTVVMGLLTFFSVLLLVLVFITDLLRPLLDPRTKVGNYA